MRFLVIIFVLFLRPITGFADEVGPAPRLARLASPALRETIEELANVERTLKTLPRISGRPSSSRLGIHSSAHASKQDPFAVQIDLRGNYPLESVALVPVGINATGSPDEGYGFPRRFRIEGSVDAEFNHPVTLVKQEAEDFANPGRHPVLFICGGIIARHLRLTVTGHSESAGQWQTALGELLVISGGRNVALGKTVTIARGREVSFPDAWQRQNLTDGHSILGPPVKEGASPSNGYLSANADPTNELKWLQIDLGRSRLADEIHLLPARPTDTADSPGMGFPIRFKLLAGYDPTFREHQVLFDHSERDFANPGENPVIIVAGRNQFRYLRLSANQLWKNEQAHVLSMAEVLIIADGDNIAQGTKVSASDQFTGARWRPEFVTDGYSSRHPVMDRQEHLRGLDQRRLLEQRRLDLTKLRVEIEDSVLATLLWTGLSLLAILLAALVYVRVRSCRESAKAAHRIRQQIAGDLHDDVGSNLGSIALLAETGIAKAGDSDLNEERFREIVATAQEAAGSMRDIVWMLKAGNSNTVELRRQMATVARAAGQGIELDLRERGDSDSRPLPLDFTRNVFLTCKESVNNARRHSQAQKLSVEIRIDQRELRLCVEDDGIGFDASAQSRGNGFGNLRDRAGSIGGSLEIQSEPGKGTRIELRVSLPLR